MNELRITTHAQTLMQAQEKDYVISIKLSGDCEGIADIVALLTKHVLPVSYDWTMACTDAGGVSTANENSIDDVAAYMSLIAKYDAHVVDVVLEKLNGNIERVVSLFDDGFVGQFQNIESMAKHHINTRTPVFAEIYTRHMDLEALGHDLLATDYKSFEKNGELYIFYRVNNMNEEMWANMGL